MTEMIQSATLFKQAGMSDEDSAKLAKISELYRNVADEQISSADASSLVISQMKAFNIEAKDAITIIDAINESSNRFAVSSSDIAKGLTVAGSSMATFGNTYSQSIGMMVGATEILQGKATSVGRGISSIGSNLAKMANGAGELSFKVNGTTKSINLLNESTGDMKNTFEILEELSKSWDQMSKAEQTSLGLDVAKKQQLPVFNALMINFNKAVEASNVALNSQGSAMKENARQADSIKVKLNALRAEFENLVLGEGGLSKFLKLLIDSGTALLKFANSDVGKATAVFSATMAIIKLAPVLFAKFTASTLALQLGLDSATIATVGFSGAIKALTVAMASNPLFVGAVVVSTAFAFSNIIDDATETTEELNTKIDNLTSSLKDLKTERDSLANNKNLTEAQENHLKLLDAEIANNERILQQEKEKAYLKYQNQQENSNNINNYSFEYAATGNVFDKDNNVRKQASLNDLMLTYKDLNNVQAESLEQEKDLADKKDVLVKSIIPYIKQLKEWKESAIELSEIDEQRLSLGEQILDSYGVSLDAIKKSTDAQEEYNSMMDLSDDEVSEFAKALKMSSDEFIENANAMGLSLSQYGEYATANQQIQKLTDDTNSSIDGLQSALGVAKQAFDEYNKSGSLTLDTFQSLLAISPDYLTALINENGQVSINQETLGNLVEQLKLVKTQELQNAAAADILAIANGNVENISNTAKGVISDLGNNAKSAGEKAGGAVGGLLSFAKGVDLIIQAQSGKGLGNLLNQDDIKKQIQAVLGAYGGLNDEINKIGVNLSSGLASNAKKGSGSSKKAAKDSTDAYKEEYQKQVDDLDHKLAMDKMNEKDYYNSLQTLNEKYFGISSGQQQKYLDEYQKNQEKIYDWEKKQKEKALKDSKSNYDKALDYIKSNLQKKADLLKKDKDDELNDIDERIDYMEKKRDKEIDRIEDKIDTLKEEKEVFVDGIESQIDALDKLKDKEEEDWDARISAYKEQNQLLKEQTDLQKLQEALAKAKSTKVKVFKGGQFVYSEDESAINEAQQNLDDYYTELKQQKELDALESAKDNALRLYEEQINSLKEYKEKMSTEYDDQIKKLEERKEQIQEYYDSRIEDMKEYRSEVEEEYNAQIEILDNYIQSFDDMVGEYDEKQNRLALVQIKGAEAEKNTWMMRLENLREFVNEYNRLQEELDEGSTNNKVNAHFKGVASVNIGARATGDSDVKSDELSLIGDKPNQELVIGGKLNGSLMKLSKGDGVVNAKSTSTLAGILNSLPNIGSKNYSENKQSGSTNSLMIDKVYVQADNAMNFIDSMSREFKVRFKQDAFAPNPV